jgi:hypothetical protein
MSKRNSSGSKSNALIAPLILLMLRLLMPREVSMDNQKIMVMQNHSLVNMKKLVEYAAENLDG